MIDESVMSKYIDDEDIEKTQAEIDAEIFIKKLTDSKALLEHDGINAGLCIYCMGTDKLYVKRSDDYEGIQYKIDNDIPMIEKCLHGRDITEDFNF